MIILNDARRVIAAAEKKAEEIGQPMNIAIADAGEKKNGVKSLQVVRECGQ